MSGDPAAEVGKPVAVDADTVAAFRRGEVEALGRVYDVFGRMVWTVAMSVVRDRQLAEDVTQETFVRAWRAAASFDGSRPLSPWLATIARRVAIDLVRRESRSTLGGHEPEQDQPVPAPLFEQAWEAWEIRVALDSLPVDERVVVRLAHFERMTHQEIAAAVGVPVGTVKSRSFRAHRRLAELLGHLRGGSESLGEASPDGALA